MMTDTVESIPALRVGALAPAPEIEVQGPIDRAHMKTPIRPYNKPRLYPTNVWDKACIISYSTYYIACHCAADISKSIYSTIC